MKSIALFLINPLIATLAARAQNYGVKTLPAPAADSLSFRINKGFNLGVSLSLGYRLNHDFMLSLTFEKLSIRQPRGFLFDYAGQVVPVNDQLIYLFNKPQP